jgi:FtsP/CotA-like multicopper oxidase with cupredoxin domain
MKRKRGLTLVVFGAALGALLFTGGAWAECAPGSVPAFDGSDTCILDPTSIPKYVTPLVIPPVMKNDGAEDSYDIAVRQFRQQILPGGIWNTINGRNDQFPATPVWSYGPDADPTPAVAPDPTSQFNYPAYTIESSANQEVSVRWINELVMDPDACATSDHPDTDEACNFRPHLLPIDQTLHWANPPMDCRMGDPRTDCAGRNPEFYEGPVPIVTHVHGAHIEGHSDGYPEAWWLPKANDIPAGYATHGTFFDDATGGNPGNLGYADYVYRNDQPATTAWYHDHSLGMTRSNVYAGPAGFWLIRGGPNDQVDNVRTRRLQWDGILPGPAPVAGQDVLSLNVPGDPVRDSIREIPIAIQDRSFKPNGELFYPDNRAFFEEVNPDELTIPFVPDSDIAPIWNPEAFFTTMVVNGVTWPSLEVAPALYRFRLLDGCNSRFLNLALKIVDSPVRRLIGQELSFYQIGAEQGFLPRVVEIRTGFATPLPGDGRVPRPADRIAAPDPDQALLMGLAERADVLVDFRFLPPGTVIRMINTGPDEPFGGFDGLPGEPAVADPATTGQVMEFVVNYRLSRLRDLFTTPPWALKLNAESPLDGATVTRDVSLNELESERVCVLADAATEEFLVPIVPASCDPNSEPPPGTIAVAFGPKEALLGTVTGSGASAEGNPLKWTDTSGASTPTPVTMADGVTIKMVNVTENPTLGDTEEWNIYNFTADAHPMHLHLVRFQVVGRTLLNGDPSPNGGVQPWETGYKDTVIAYPGEITTIRATFDIAGLYVWHCHIVEHEDNEMMRPYVVSAP